MSKKANQITRRDFLKKSAGVAAATIVAPMLIAPNLTGCSYVRRKQPNVFLITLDTTRRDHLSCYGYPRATTPNIDALARDSVVFEDGYATANQTREAHGSILTGLYPYQCLDITQEKINSEVPTLQSILSAKGYSTGAATSAFFMDNESYANGQFNLFSAPAIETGERVARKTVDEATKIIDSMKKNPVFFWLHFYDPHHPYNPPEKYKKIYYDGKIENTDLEKLMKRGANPIRDPSKDHEFRLTPEEEKAYISQYDGEIAYMDSQLGRFFQYLEQNQMSDNSIFWVAADHGESLFEREDCMTAHNASDQPVLQIPMIIKAPGLKPGRVNGLVQQTDIVPTVLQMLSIKSPETDGYDLTRLIQEGVPVRDKILFEEGRVSHAVGIIAEDEKYKLKKGMPIKEPFLSPQNWNAELKSLPRIKLNNPIKQEYRFGEEVRIDCNIPSELEGKLKECYLETVMGRTGETFRFSGFTKTVEIADGIEEYRRFLGYPFNTRVVAIDDGGNTIATSESFIVNIKPKENSELYDLKQDPNERQNLASQMPEKVDELERRMQDFESGVRNYRDKVEKGIESVHPLTLEEQSERDKKLDALKKLGYIK